MSVELWLAFALASAVLLALPGPVNYLVTTYVIGKGRKTALATIPGTTIGIVTAMMAAALLAGGVQWLSSGLFDALQWAGVGYLMLYALWVWRAPVVTGVIADNDNLPEKKFAGMFAHAYATAAFTPRSILLFVAFVAQFLDGALPILRQVAEFQATLLVLATLVGLVHMALAKPAFRLMRAHTSRKTLRRPGHTVFISRRAVTAGYRKIAA
jgi:threonine/homoserine/homoserine lactone efflux protein